MKTVILAAGKGTRLMPLTINKPKPLVKIVNKPILEHILDSIQDFTTEVTIVNKYKGDEIKNYFGDKYKNISLSHIKQGEENGTAAALWNIEKLDEDFVVLNGDTIYSCQDLEKLYHLDGYGCLVKKVDNPENYGIFKQDNEGFAVSIVEKPQDYIGNLANMGVYKFPARFLEIVKNIKLSPRGEYELPDAINTLLKDTQYKLIEQKEEFIDVGYPKHILKANNYILEKMGEKNLIGEDTFIEKNVKLGDNVVVGKKCEIYGNLELENIQICDNVVLKGDGVYKNKIITKDEVIDC